MRLKIRLKTAALRVLLIIGIALISTGCAPKTQSLDFRPNLPRVDYVLPSDPKAEDYWRIMVGLRKERNACYDDLGRLEIAHKQINSKWWEFWK